MKALQINAYGNHEVVVMNHILSQPLPGDKQLLIQMKAAGVNPVDWKIRAGYLKDMKPMDLPLTLGMDFSGVVVGVGEDVQNFHLNDEVFGCSNIFDGGTGTFAEYLVVDENVVAIKPKNLSHAEVAALPMAALSAWQALKQCGESTNKKIVIHGGAGGIGHIAISLAKHLGFYVATTARKENMPWVKALGADEVIDYQQQNFEKVLSDYDAVLDLVGGDTYEKSFQVLKKGGVLVSMLEAPNETLMSAHAVNAHIVFASATYASLTHLASLIDEGIIQVHLDKVFSLDEAASALDYIEHHRPRGKVVIVAADG